MRLIIGSGSGLGFYPYTQKPVDLQPYRPIYLFRGSPPDFGASYGLYEDEEEQRQYYAEQGLEPFSPFTGKPAKLIEEVNFEDLKKAVNLDKLQPVQCTRCNTSYYQNFADHLKGRSWFHCHRCGAPLET
jgi:hypothetical protein